MYSAPSRWRYMLARAQVTNRLSHKLCSINVVLSHLQLFGPAYKKKNKKNWQPQNLLNVSSKLKASYIGCRFEILLNFYIRMLISIAYT